MIITLKPDTPAQEKMLLMNWIAERGLEVDTSAEGGRELLRLIGDTAKLDVDMIRMLEMVESVHRVSDPFKKANRLFHPEDTVIDVGGVRIGGRHFAVIAGPCSVESEEQIIGIARRVKAAGATLLRGGAFKPRTSPYAFQGMKADGIELLLKAKEATGLPIVTEIMNENHLPLFEEVDIIQVGARNMQNFELLKALGRLRKPILLKRGLANTLQELLMSAEYIMAGGNDQILLCERGIRTFEPYTRNTLDISAVPALHVLSHLPVVVDPSHATGISSMVEPMALASAACSADAIMIEVHNDPPHALSDGPQSLTPDQFDQVMEKIRRVRAAAGPEVE
ncbi:MAG: 3-deoxy-7-phosphoheptulonate synthase [Mogibacterium sp.]|nr:3-deoxy-7-phosphoheptulonate synthase [Mogibacterium sp.]